MKERPSERSHVGCGCQNVATVVRRWKPCEEGMALFVWLHALASVATLDVVAKTWLPSPDGGEGKSYCGAVAEPGAWPKPVT